ncbi:MAG: glycosyltransferase [Planctomycetota bacterium]
MKTAAICIATYRREEGLRRLLVALNEQVCPEGWSSEVRVVNNDAEADQTVFESTVHDASPGARTAVEPRRNIAHARNTAVTMGDADAFVFIDDDEIPTEGWLASLLNRLADADAVFGPVAGRVPEGTPRWLVRSGAFDKPGPDHDGPMDWRGSRTSSTAVRAEWIGRGTRFFDPDYGSSGGSDTEFFRRIEEQGARFVHERGGLVYEDVEADRCEWRAVLTRRFRAGAVFGRMERGKGQLYRWSRVMLRCGAACFGLVRGAPPAAIGRPEHAFNALCRLAIAIGAWKGHNAAFRVTRYPPKSQPTRPPAIAANGGV